VKYAVRDTTPTALVLVWNASHSLCAILELDLLLFTSALLLEVRTPDHFQELINTFEIAHGHLLVANLNGLVSIYAYPGTGQKLGYIQHQNSVGEIIECHNQLKNTSLHMKAIMILERRTEKSEGSLAVYLLR
jgi:hypothetical protein